ncbi:sensor histidine kinase [Streptomyces sp. NPDC002577]
MDGVNLVHAIDDPAAPRTRRQGCVRAAGITVLVLLAVADLLIAGAGGGAVWPAFLVLPLGMAAVLWPAARRPAWLPPQLRTAVPACLSAAVTVVATVTGRLPEFGPGEVAVMLCLLLVAVRTCPPKWVVWCAALDGAAVLAQPLRSYRSAAGSGDLGNLFGVMLALVLLVGVAAGLGGYLRVLDHRRTVAVTETRRSERLDMAADLHDFVAHHVTGVLVQTQMARMLAATEPDRLDPVLAGIERAATEALASMRRTVGILREGPEPSAGAESGGVGPGTSTTWSPSASRRPVGDLASLAGLVEDFGGPAGPKAVLRQDPYVPDGLPHEVQAAAYRVVQEALTNVRRHAADATEVTVGLDHDGRNLTVTVRDDGRGGAGLPHAARGGGFGLVGLTERVAALGGELHAGPRRPHGWEVAAVLPSTGAG